MLQKPLAICCFVLMVLAAACGGSDDNGEEPGPDAGSQPPPPSNGAAGTIQPPPINGAGSGGGGGGGGGDGGSGGGPSEPQPGTCGDGVVDAEQGEVCDDANDDNEDGCTNLCAFTCEDDPDCDDFEICNGEETCSEEHVCVPSTEIAPDGEVCGDNSSCHEGQCLEHICNNGVVQAEEECDDGDELDDNGCTRQCIYTCHVGETHTIVNDCAPMSTCDEEAHMWVGGDPLPDGTICNDGEGYCMNGVCFLGTCGDGVVEPNEECDLGEQNGAPDSGCTETCTTSVCGDGEIDGREGCDDGNLTNLDGCDDKCKPEVHYRGTNLWVSLENAPDYCVHVDNENNGNAFANLFPDQGLLDIINIFIQDAMANGEAHTLFQVLDVEDFSSTEPDPLANLGLSMGQFVGEWDPLADHLDVDFNAFREFYDEDLKPLRMVPGELVIEGGLPVVQSTAPTVAGFDIMDTLYVLHDLMSRIETDGNLSALTPPPAMADHVQAPETVGNHGAEPTGVLCGALHVDAFDSMPLPEAFLVLCLDQFGQFTPCAEGQNPRDGECDSVLDLFKIGCSDFAGAITFLTPVGEPDVDSDGDGENDAYSAVVRVSAERVKVVGVMDRPPPPDEAPAE